MVVPRLLPAVLILLGLIWGGSFYFIKQLLEVFGLSGMQWSLVGTWNADEVVSAPPFQAISFSLADLWPLDRPLGFEENPQHLFAGDR